MCGSGYRVSENAGVLYSLLESEWLPLAQELCELSDKDFRNVLEAFMKYREAVRSEKNKLPPRPKTTRPPLSLKKADK